MGEGLTHINSVIKKFSFSQTLVISACLICGIFVINMIVKNLIVSDIEDTLTNRIMDIRSSIKILDESSRETSLTSLNVLKSQIKNISIDTSSKVTINGIQTSTLMSDGVVLNNNKLIDEFTKITGAILLLFTVLGVSYLIIRKIVNEPLVTIDKNLSEFFAYANREKEDIVFENINTNDEFGRMSKILSQNIDKTKASIEEDKKLIQEIIRVLSEFEDVIYVKE